MKIEKKYKPELVASKDAMRVAIQDCYIDQEGDKQVLIATDGRCLVCLPCEAEKSEIGHKVPKKAIIFARSNAERNDTFIEFSTGDKITFPNGWTMPALDQEEFKFPAWQQVLPNCQIKHRAALSVDLLSRVAKAMGADQVVLEFGSEHNAITVRPYGAEGYGIVMPLRLP